MRFLSFIILFCLISCKDSSNIVTIDNSQEFSNVLVNKSDIENLKYVEFLADSKVKKQISDWEKYNELDRLVLDVKDANLSFFKGNKEIVNTLCEEFKSTIPENMNTPQVFSRIMALETKILKLESVVNLSKVEKEKALETIKEFLVAFSNLNLQMNKKIEKESQNIQKPY